MLHVEVRLTTCNSVLCLQTGELPGNQQRLMRMLAHAEAQGPDALAGGHRNCSTPVATCFLALDASCALSPDVGGPGKRCWRHPGLTMATQLCRCPAALPGLRSLLCGAAAAAAAAAAQLPHCHAGGAAVQAVCPAAELPGEQPGAGAGERAWLPGAPAMCQRNQPGCPPCHLPPANECTALLGPRSGTTAQRVTCRLASRTSQRFCRLPFVVAQWLLQHAPADRGETRESWRAGVHAAASNATCSYQQGMNAKSIFQLPGNRDTAACWRQHWFNKHAGPLLQCLTWPTCG